MPVNEQSTLTIEAVTAEVFDKIWPIFQAVIQAGDTYPYPPDMAYDAAKALWFAPEKRIYVARENGQVVGTYYLRDAQPGLGSHVCNAGYMVSPDTRGKGIGRALGRHSLLEAKRLGYSAMQYNLVVSTNTAGVHLWQSLGFKILATLPKAFNHRELGLVDAYLMFRSLEDQ